MKLKRIILSAVCAGLSVLGLASCGEKDASVEVVDAEGNVTKEKIEATTDEEEVTQSIETMLNTKVDEEAIKNIKALTVSADASLSGDVTVLKTTTNVAMSASAKAALFFGDEYGVDASANYSIDVKNSSATYNSKGDAAVFTDSNTVYASLSTTGLLAEDFKYSMDLAEAEAELGEYANQYIGQIMETEEAQTAQATFEEYAAEAKEAIASLMEEYGYTEEDIKAYVEGGYLKVSDELSKEIAAFVEKFDVTISATTKDTVTYSANVAADENTSVAVTLTLSTKTLLPVAATADFSAAVPAIVMEIVEEQLGGSVDLSGIAGMLSSETQNCKGNASVTITYSAKKESHSTDGYTAVTVSDIMAEIQKNLPQESDKEAAE